MLAVYTRTGNGVLSVVLLSVLEWLARVGTCILYILHSMHRQCELFFLLDKVIKTIKKNIQTYFLFLYSKYFINITKNLFSLLINTTMLRRFFLMFTVACDEVRLANC